MSQHASEFAIEAGWRLVFKDLNISQHEVLKRAALPGDLFTRANLSLSAEDFFKLWRALESCVGDPAFPLRLGSEMATEAFHPLFFAALCSPNLNVAMQRIAHYKRLVGPMKLAVDSDEQRTRVSLGFLFADQPIPDTLLALELVFLVKLARMATREEIVPIGVSSSSRALLECDEYADYFGVRPRRAADNSVSFAAADARRPFLTENPAMWNFFEPELRKRLGDLEEGADMRRRVQSALFELLPGGRSSIDDVADKLLISKRSLQRGLSNENTTFQKELQLVREKLARHYLTQSDLPGEQISFLLGFDDPNSFARAFRAWTGDTPGAVRRLQRM